MPSRSLPTCRTGKPLNRLGAPNSTLNIPRRLGLYSNPPARAIVLCVDEKSQIQALERTQPSRPVRPGRPQRHTHKLVARCYPRQDLHVVVDNYATHKHAKVQAWLAKHPRVHLRFTPTYPG